MKPTLSNCNYLPTGIGSLPHQDVEKVCRLVLENFPEIPFWPQLPKRSFFEGMNVQYSEAFPNVVINEADKRIFIDTQKGLEEGLAKFYEKFLANDIDYFAISPQYAPGFHTMIKLLKSSRPKTIKFIKGQVTGPITMSQALVDQDGKAIAHNSQLADAVIKQLIMKARWQIKLLKELGYPIIIFIDEPVLSSFGSAYSTIKKEEITKGLNEIIKAIHDESSLVGVHCCGNTDWPVLLETELDILSFDAYSFLDKLALYPEALNKFLSQGGTIAWGWIPTDSDNLAQVLSKPEPAKEILKRIENSVSLLNQKGITIKQAQSLITPACGMGSILEKEAEGIIKLLRKVYQGLSQ